MLCLLLNGGRGECREATLLARYLNRYSLSSMRTFDSHRNGPKSTGFGSIEHKLLPIGEFSLGNQWRFVGVFDRESRLRFEDAGCICEILFGGRGVSVLHLCMRNVLPRPPWSMWSTRVPGDDRDLTRCSDGAFPYGGEVVSC